MSTSQPGEWPRWVRALAPWVAYVLSAAGTVGATLFGSMASKQAEPWVSRPFWIAVTCALVPITLVSIKEAIARREKRRREQEATEAIARYKLAIGTVLRPCVERLHGMTLGREEATSEAWGSILSKILDGAKLVCGPESNDLRVVYFSNAGKSDALSVEDFSGTVRPSRRVFKDEEDDAAGRAVWKHIREGETVLWEDLEKSAPEGYTPSATGRDYKTFISAPVVWEDRPFGMLNADSLRARDLTQTDVDTMALFASVLAVAEDLRRRGAESGTGVGAPSGAH